MTASRATASCPTEDELLVLGRTGALSERPDLDAHFASCATCSALLGEILERATARKWDALAGTQLGPYRLEQQIGSGGMGAVYQARDSRLDRTIAIKVLHDDTSAKRRAAEARAAAAIDHPAIVAIYDVGTTDDFTFIAMELVEGESLRSVIERGPMPAARARQLAAELADALAVAHARGVIHRDLKPENLVLARDGRLRILDFGLAKVADIDPLDATEPGTVQGTAGYMAPEQVRGEAADERVDLFAAGAILFELVTGRRAFPGATHADRMSAVLRDTPPLDELGALAPIVERCIAKDPPARFRSAADLGWALRQQHSALVANAPVRGERTIGRRTLLVAGGGAALAALTGLGGFWLGRRRRAPLAVAARPEFNQLTYKTGRIYTARFTGDASRVVFGAAWDADPVHGFVADLANKTTSRLGFAGDVLAISKRGDLAVSLGRRFTNHQSATGTLALVPLAGGAQRVLAESVQDADFAPDGSLAVIRAVPAGFALEFPLGTTLVESPTWITHPRVSPNGKQVAFLRHPHVNDDAGDLVIVDVATRKTETLVAQYASIAGLAWRPSGDSIWFTAARDHGQNFLHSVSLDATIRVVAQTTGRMRLHDLAPDGRAAISVEVWRLRTHAGGGTFEVRDRSLSEVSYVVDISAEGSTLAITELGNAESAHGTYLVPLDGSPPLRMGDGFALAISPSGTRVAATEFADGVSKLVAYSTASAAREQFSPPGHVKSARWLDEQTLVASAKGRVWRLAAGAEPVALTEPGVEGKKLVVDPRRGRCAFVDDQDRLQIIELATGAVRTLPAPPGRRFACGWLADPDAIVLCTPTTPLELVRIDPATGASSPHMTLQPPPVGLKAVDSVVLHSDGKRYAYSYGQELSHLFIMTLAK